jgi:hypothetical protein
VNRLDIAAANEPDELGRDEARATAGRRSMTLDAATSLGTMNRRDRLGNLMAFAAAAVAWLVVGIVVTTRDPIREPDAGLLGAGAIGIACGLTAIPLFWLAAYARRRRVAYRGSWVRAVRRGAWVAIVVALFVALRIQGAFQLPIALFVLTMVVIAEATLSVER